MYFKKKISKNLNVWLFFHLQWIALYSEVVQVTVKFQVVNLPMKFQIKSDIQKSLKKNGNKNSKSKEKIV